MVSETTAPSITLLIISPCLNETAWRFCDQNGDHSPENVLVNWLEREIAKERDKCFI